MTTRTLQRLERILVLVPWLLENQGVTVDEVVARFGVTRVELADDLDVLGYCGLPGYGGGDLVEASIVGDRVVVRLADFFARPLNLSVSEAVTLLLAGRALGGVEGLAETAALNSAVAKLEQLLGADAARVAVDITAPGDELLAPLRGAVADGKVVRILYRSAARAQTQWREVEPWAVVGHLGSWYLQGWARDADGERDFRLDRIKELQITDEVVDAGRRSDPGPPVYEPGPDDETVVLALQPGVAWVAEWLVTDEVRQEKDHLEVRLRTRSLDWVARLVLQLGGAAVVVEPATLRERVAHLAQVTLRNYG